MKLSEARAKFIGKTFRVKHAERGYYKQFIIEDVTGVCSAIEPAFFIFNGVQHCLFRFRIDAEGVPSSWRWFSAREIEPVEVKA